MSRPGAFRVPDIDNRQRSRRWHRNELSCENLKGVEILAWRCLRYDGVRFVLYPSVQNPDSSVVCHMCLHYPAATLPRSHLRESQLQNMIQASIDVKTYMMNPRELMHLHRMSGSTQESEPRSVTKSASENDSSIIDVKTYWSSRDQRRLGNEALRDPRDGDDPTIATNSIFCCNIGGVIHNYFGWSITSASG